MVLAQASLPQREEEVVEEWEKDQIEGDEEKTCFWLFTLNLPKAERLALPTNPLDWLPMKQVKYVTWQKEKAPTTGTLHLQGYVVFTVQKRFVTVKKLHKFAHWERRRGTHEQARDYCQKEETRVEVGGTAGSEDGLMNKKPGTRNDLIELKNGIDESVKTGGNPFGKLYQDNFKHMLMYGRGIDRYINFIAPKRDFMPEVIVYYGPPGSNKSRRAWNGVINTAYSKAPTSKWWDGYVNQEVVIVDDYRGDWSLDYLLTLCDRYPIQVEIKGGTVAPVFKKIIFTANEHPKDWSNMNMMFYLEWDAHPFKRRIAQLVECKKTDLFE